MKRPQPASPSASRIPFALMALAAAVGALLVILRRTGRGAENTQTNSRGLIYQAPTIIDTRVVAAHEPSALTIAAPAPQTPAPKPARPSVSAHITTKPIAKRLSTAEIVRRGWPLALAIVVLLAVVAALVNDSTARNDGHLIYDLDDAYIHMAMARHFSQDGLWSVTRFEAFTSATSSPLWTLLLSVVYWIFGVSEAAPFIMNVVCAVLLLVVVHLIFDRHRLNGLTTLIALLALIFFVPLPNLIFTGMEHTLQLLIDVLFIDNAARLLTLSDGKSRLAADLSGRVLVLALFVPIVRYEGIFIVAIVCALFAARWRWGYAGLLGMVAALPVVLYGLFSMVNGWNFLPNSLLLKARPQNVGTLDGIIRMAGFADGHAALFNYPPLTTLLFTLVVLLFVGYARRKTLWEISNLLLLVTLVTLLLHVQFASVGWFFRYEAYLIGLSAAAIALSLRDYFPDRFEAWMRLRAVPAYISMFALLFVVTLPMLFRANEVFGKIALATTNIYEQQYQMGTFLREFYDGQLVALNDIGATTFLADIRLLDMYGLASRDVATAKLNGAFDVDFIYRINRESDTQIAIIYDRWYAALPEQWSKVGEWTIHNNVVVANTTVSFYAVDPNAREALIESLRAFAPRLPETITQTGVYME